MDQEKISKEENQIIGRILNSKYPVQYAEAVADIFDIMKIETSEEFEQFLISCLNNYKEDF